MKLSKAVVLIAATIFTSSAAMAFNQSFLDNSVSKVLKAAPKQKRSTNTCEDFSGKWKGECKHSDGKVESQETLIEQKDCFQFSFNKQESFDVPGFVTQTKSSGLWNGSLSMAMNWNSNGTVLQMVGSGLFAGQSMSPMRVEVNIEMFKENGELVTGTKLNSPYQSTDSECRFVKQP